MALVGITSWLSVLTLTMQSWIASVVHLCLHIL